jgi:hypothetical protein
MAQIAAKLGGYFEKLIILVPGNSAQKMHYPEVFFVRFSPWDYTICTLAAAIVRSFSPMSQTFLRFIHERCTVFCNHSYAPVYKASLI